ncbi:hypothetical protein A2130_01845 [Candidatus Woesebacteria bacterium GWC2_33_12]|nr:MAG: hypothetical protein A2130_01845 [Candidatus Woesebacteria bacterium GWC2_33_12]OGM81100.1 MAG: hypothetical protein A2366_02450 [Candidatus Woesebacteria bacterium RIFOXYB1_FULL_33_9]HCR36505.1 hypothetical protein [Candidatus Woesebacteria bacterium]
MKLSNLQHLPKDSEVMKTWFVIYCRKSSEGDDRQMASIDSQFEVLRAYAKQNNLPILQEFSESKSAKAPDRVEFNKMVKLLETRKDIKGILAWDTSRLFRNPVDEGRIRWILDSQIIEIIVTPFKTFTKDDSSLLLAVEGGKSQAFIQDLTRNTWRGLNKKVDAGIAPILAPCGYYNDMTLLQGERDIKPHPVYFDLMAQVLRMAMTGKYSTEALRIQANRMGLKNSRGKEISRSQIYRMLRNPFYCGKFMYNKSIYDGVHKPILTPTEFDALQDVLDGKANPRTQTHSFAYSGAIKCKTCGYHFTFETKIKKSGLVFNYGRCSRKSKSECSQPRVNLKDLDQQIDSFLDTMTVSEAFVDWARYWVKQAESQDRSVRDISYSVIKRDHTETTSKLNVLNDKWLSGQLTDSEYREMKQTYTQKLFKLDEELKLQDEGVEAWTDLMLDTLQFASRAKYKWNHGTIDDRKTILKVIGSDLLLDNKKLEIKANTPFMLIQKAVSADNQIKVVSDSQIEPKLRGNYVFSPVWGD